MKGNTRVAGEFKFNAASVDVRAFLEKKGTTKGGKNYKFQGGGFYSVDRLTGARDYGASLAFAMTWK